MLLRWQAVVVAQGLFLSMAVSSYSARHLASQQQLGEQLHLFGSLAPFVRAGLGLCVFLAGLAVVFTLGLGLQRPSLLVLLALDLAVLLSSLLASAFLRGWMQALIIVGVITALYALHRLAIFDSALSSGRRDGI